MEGLDGGTSAGIPDADIANVGSRDDARAIWRKRDGVVPLGARGVGGVAIEGLDGGTSAGIPDSGRAIIRHREDARAVWRKPDMSN
jgi:hypothetical protein